VKLTLTHAQLSAAYGLRPAFGVSLRLPYDIKDQTVRYTTLAGEPFTPPYGDIHHRSETLRGLSDGDLLLLWAPSKDWRVGIGTTLPFGATVEDPVALGRAGLKHEHLQFGSGVFAPEAEVTWSHAMRNATLSAMLQATIPLTTNRRGFRAPKNFQWTIGPSVRQVTLSLAGQYQTVGRWNGETDEGTGFSNGGVRLQWSIPASRDLTITPSIYHELYSHGFNDETFSQGRTAALTISRAF